MANPRLGWPAGPLVRWMGWSENPGRKAHLIIEWDEVVGTTRPATVRVVKAACGAKTTDNPHPLLPGVDPCRACLAYQVRSRRRSGAAR